LETSVARRLIASRSVGATEDVPHEPVRDWLAALFHVVVDRGQRVDVVCELVGEQGLGDGRGAVEDVRATIVVLERWPGDRVKPDHHQSIGVQLQRGLQRRVEPHAAVAVPALTDKHGRNSDWIALEAWTCSTARRAAT
jgi:hypothetical protein